MTLDRFLINDFNKRLKSWYVQNHRPLPWRKTNDPYKIWLSEIILQQTRVAQGLPYYERFLTHYPTIFDLARADEREVLRLWQGLGYYSRARNMHFTARQVVNEFGGQFPGTSKELGRLKGLGTYTAAAIASFAFGEPVAAIDGNVYRVLARLFGIRADMLGNEGKKEFASMAAQLVPDDDPATFNQAMIEFGALQCVPVSPKCTVCPFNDFCYAFATGSQNELPVKIKKLKVRQRFLNYLMIRYDGMLAMKERRGRDIWTGLYDFYLVESASLVTSPDYFAEDASLRRLLETGTIREVPKTYTHVLTHQRLQVRFWWVELSRTDMDLLPAGLAFYRESEIETLPKPILIDTVLREEGYLSV